MRHLQGAPAATVRSPPRRAIEGRTSTRWAKCTCEAAAPKSAANKRLRRQSVGGPGTTHLVLPAPT
eukprot:scaffold1847_cov131-Isochrysis_galbana.AAC.7